MKLKNLIPLKAMFLLIVFCMSTMVSFACAMGVEMGYNEKHHEEVAIKASSTQQHDDSHEHSENVKHQHSKSNNNPSGKKAEDDCCKKEAKKFGQFDKLVSKVSVDIHHPVLFVSFIQSFYSFDVQNVTKLIYVKSNLYRSHHPPIPDKLIAFQSFLI